MDCYRLEDQEEDLGFEEYFEDQAITVYRVESIYQRFTATTTSYH